MSTLAVIVSIANGFVATILALTQLRDRAVQRQAERNRTDPG